MNIVSHSSTLYVSVFREPEFPFGHPAEQKVTLFLFRVPFFFEPNFDAFIKPLDAALRMQAGDSDFLHPNEKRTVQPNRAPVTYGDFLMKKVGGNFILGKGKYD